MAGKFQTPEPSHPAFPDEDDKAAKEESALALGLDLSDKRTSVALNRVDRSDKMDNHLHRVLVCMVYLVGFLIGLAAIVLFYHYMAPDDWLVLTEERLQALKNFPFFWINLCWSYRDREEQLFC